MSVKRYRVYDEQDGIEWYTCFDPELPRDKDDQQYVVLATDHEAELAKYRLGWTDEKPTVEGAYWFREEPEAAKSLVYIVSRRGLPWQEFIEENDGRKLSEVNGQFAGPIPQPEG